MGQRLSTAWAIKFPRRDFRPAQRNYSKSSSGLCHKCTLQHCNGVFLPSVACSFAASSTKEPKLKKLQSRVARLHLPRLGYSRGAPKAAACGPAEHGGLGLKGLCLEQGQALSAASVGQRLGKPLVARIWLGKHKRSEAISQLATPKVL